MKKTGDINVALASVYRRRGDDIEFLIIKRVPHDGAFWQPVTGRIEEGETPKQAAIREVIEEVGIDIHLHVSDELMRSEWLTEDGRKGIDILHAVEVAAESRVVLSEEHEDYKWLLLEDAMQILKYENNKQSLRVIYEYAKLM
ncbi:MAG: NUDIX domain-containing protein [Candidatus Woesebacteria bacterium]|jgi:8-oxo-dGTP pyrophosphatase MutT (NUDIX family)